MDQHQERDVARGLRASDPDAWRALYDAFARRVWRSVARLMGPATADLADVVQETFLAAARSAHRYDPERGPIWPWLWGIARVHVALHYRKQERLHQARLRLIANGTLYRRLDGCADGTDTLVAEELAALVRITLTELPVEYEMLLTAKYIEGESVESIADRDRTTQVAVRSKLARARQAFREAFLRQSPGPDGELPPPLGGRVRVGGKETTPPPDASPLPGEGEQAVETQP